MYKNAFLTFFYSCGERFLRPWYSPYCTWVLLCNCAHWTANAESIISIANSAPGLATCQPIRRCPEERKHLCENCQYTELTIRVHLALNTVLWIFVRHSYYPAYSQTFGRTFRIAEVNNIPVNICFSNPCCRLSRPSYLQLCASVAKQYNLVRPCLWALWKGSLPPDLWLMSSAAKKPGSAPRQRS